MKKYTAICIDSLGKVDTYDFESESLEKAKQKFLSRRILATGYETVRILETTGSVEIGYEKMEEMYEKLDNAKMHFYVESHIDYEKGIFK